MSELKNLLKDYDVKITKRETLPNLFEIVFLILLVCKITGVIAWSWWIVFLPLILEFAAVIIFILCFMLLFKWVKEEDEKGNNDIE